MSTSDIVIRSVLISISKGQLLLPSAVVVEVTPYQEPETIAENQPDWLLGSIEWRGQRIPVLSAEEVFSLPPPNSSAEKYRMVILYGLEANQMMPYYSFVTTDVPRTLAVKEDGLTDPREEQRPGLLGSVNVLYQKNSELAWLPDLAYLENLLRKSVFFVKPSATT